MTITRDEAERFLIMEARLLDEERFEEWFGLFAEDGHYWLPLDEHADPRRSSSIIYDDRTFLDTRIYQLEHASHFTQVPRSRTLHHIANIDVEALDAAEDLSVIRSNLALAEVRPGDWRQGGLGKLRWFAARCEHQLREHGDGEWRIVLKKVVLLNREQPIENLTFLI